MKLTNRLQTAIENRGLTIAECARKAEVHRDTLWNAFRVKAMSRSTAGKIAKVLGESADWVLRELKRRRTR